MGLAGGIGPHDPRRSEGKARLGIAAAEGAQALDLPQEMGGGAAGLQGRIEIQDRLRTLAIQAGAQPFGQDAEDVAPSTS